MTKMLTSAIGVAALAALTLASAPARAQYNWSGIYLGGQIGQASGRTGDWTFPNQPAPNALTTTPRFDQGLWGAHFGIQHQFAGSRLVLGVEASLSGQLRDANASVGTAGSYISGINAPGHTADIGRLTQVMTIGPRLGWAFDRWLPYVTAGLARGDIDTTIYHNKALDIADGHSQATHRGWFAGAGVDWAASGNWILGLEYQRLSFATADHDTPQPIAASYLVNHRFRADADVVRARIGYKFGGDDAVRQPTK